MTSPHHLDTLHFPVNTNCDLIFQDYLDDPSPPQVLYDLNPFISVNSDLALGTSVQYCLLTSSCEVDTISFRGQAFLLFLWYS